MRSYSTMALYAILNLLPIECMHKHGVVIGLTKKSFHLPGLASVFQAETCAIMEAANHLLERGLRNANVAFFSEPNRQLKHWTLFDNTRY